MIELAKDGALWTVTLNRPHKANALTVGMLETLDRIFAQAQQDDALRVLVITGAGTRVFCAGADLGEARNATSITTNPVWERMSNRLANLPCLTIAALNGTVAGGGFALALACDLRVSVQGARFFYPVLKNRFLPQPSDVGRMIALIGPSRTRLILLAGQKLSADEALRFGLVDRIATPDNLQNTVATLAQTALAAPLHVLVAIKRLGDAAVTRATRDDCFSAVYDGDIAALDRLRAGKIS